MALPRALVVFLTFSTASEAFFSSAMLELDRESALKTLDHAIITRIGLLRCLIEFLKDNPRYIDEEMAGKFKDLQRMVITAGTPDKVQNLFSVMMPRMRLQNVINEIQRSNAEVNTAPLKSVATAHFSGEQFKEGSKRLLELKSQIVTSLLKGVKFEYTRQLAGQYLHTLQDFYSHSNWVELETGVRKFYALTNPAISIPSQFVAKLNEETCTSCPLAIDQKDNCDNNLVIQKITSGYYGGQDISKPTNVSKCGHGGILDSSRNQGTMGGINKEAATRKWSPHYKLHTVAAEHAIEATKKFFEDLRTTVGDDIFARFLDLQAVRTLALVIDDTGSMGGANFQSKDEDNEDEDLIEVVEIKSVRKLSTDFVQKTENPTGNTAFVYILVPFNDPRVGPVTVTSNPEEVIQAVSSLKANGGGDCPELGMTGLYQALLQSVEDSAIYFFSDADAKDLMLAQVVLILAKQKRVKINFILSGRCSYGRKRRSSIAEAHLGSQRLYQSLASATGGQVLRTKKNKVSVLVDIIGSKSSGGDFRDLTEVILLYVKSDAKEKAQDIQFSIDVDNTLEDILIVLSAEADPSITLLNPTENQSFTAKVYSQFDSIHVTEVRNFKSGSLVISVRCTGPYSLQVTGQSTLDFTYQLSSVENLDTGESKRLLGSPVKGQTLLLNLAFTKPEFITEVNSLSLLNSNGAEMESFTVERGQGIHSDSYYVLFTPTAERFRFQLTGKTTDGKILRRVKPTEIQIGEVQFDYRSVNYSGRIFPGITANIPLKIKNVGSSQNLSLKAMDDLGFIKSLVPNYLFVGENDTAQFSLVMKAPANASSGEASTVSIYATATSSGKLSNYMVFYVSVTTKEDDNSPPRCQVNNRSATCDAVYNLSTCSNMTWTAYTSVLDLGKGLLKITAKNSKLGKLNVAPFAAGISNKSTPAVYTSTCCHPTASIVAVDQLGNTGVCELSAVTQVINIKTDTKYSKLNVIVGETSKLEFNITNLGTKGSFALEVSENKYYIGYVTPLNIKMDHREVVRCEVVLIGNRETGSNETRLVVEATPLEKELNTQDTRLLQMSVVVQARKEDRPKPSLELNITTDLDPEPKIIIHYGVNVVLSFTVTNNGLAGMFYFKSSTSSVISTQFTPNPVYLNNSQTTLLKLELKAKQNQLLEETMLVSVTSHSSNNEARLFSRNVTIILREESPIHSLRSLVPSGKVVINAGAIARVNFTVINVGQAGQFNFKVSSPASVTCHVTPKAVTLMQNESLSGQLIVKSSVGTESGNMQVNVTAEPTLTKRKKINYHIFNLEIVIKNTIIEATVKEEEKPTTITIIGILVGCVLLLALLLLVICLCVRKRGSWNVWRSKSKQKKEGVKVEISNQDNGVDKPQMV